MVHTMLCHPTGSGWQASPLSTTKRRWRRTVSFGRRARLRCRASVATHTSAQQKRNSVKKRKLTSTTGYTVVGSGSAVNENCTEAKQSEATHVSVANRVHRGRVLLRCEKKVYRNKTERGNARQRQRQGTPWPGASPLRKESVQKQKRARQRTSASTTGYTVVGSLRAASMRPSSHSLIGSRGQSSRRTRPSPRMRE